MKHRRQAGYSLPEMLTVVAIIGVLALVTVPAFINFYQAGKMRASMRNFTTDLRGMRQMAITKGVQTQLSYGTGTPAYLGFIAGYLICMAITWAVYLRPSARRLVGV